VFTDAKHEKFYFIEKNEQRGVDYTTKGWIFVQTDIAWFATFLDYVSTFRFQNWLAIHVRTLVYICWDSVSQWRETQVLAFFAMSPSPVDPRNCNHIVLRHVSISTHKDAYQAGILSDFHTQPTNMFRLFVACLMVILTGVSVYYYLFDVPDIGLITIGDRTLGLNPVERNVYSQILVV